MWTSAETVVTTTSITAVSVSMRSAQSTASVPDENQLNTGTRSTSPLAEADGEEGDPRQQRRDHQEAGGDDFRRARAFRRGS